jgi:hypothetical protein
MCVLMGCSDSDEPTWRALPECPHETYTRCDVRDASCQRRLLSLAGCAYGVDEVPEVPIRTLSEQELIDELADADDDRSPEQKADEAAELAHIERAFGDLKLLRPGDLTEDSETNVAERIAGVYQGREAGIVLVDRGEPQDSFAANDTLVHELVHAIQDAEVDLSAWRLQFPGDVDTSLALRSTTEGQATLIATRVSFAMQGYPATESALRTSFTRYQTRLVKHAYEDASPYFGALTTFPYAFGAMNALNAWATDGAGFTSRQFEQPPLTCLSVLERATGRADRAHSPPELIDPTLPEGYAAVDTTVLGAFLLELVVGAWTGAARAPSLLGEGWEGDRMWIAASPDGETEWLWEVAFNSEDRAAEVARALLGPLGMPSAIGGKREGVRLYLTSKHANEGFIGAGEAFLSGD